MHRRHALAASLTVLLAAPSICQAQETPDGLAGLLLRFFSPTNPVVLQAAPDPFSHAAHFVSQPNAQETLRQLNRGIASQLSTFPLGSSSAGFTYTFDPELGVFNRSTETFGPVFAERPLTAGKGKFSFGATQLHATYDSFEGQDLKDGDIKLYLIHQDVNQDGSHHRARAVVRGRHHRSRALHRPEERHHRPLRELRRRRPVRRRGRGPLPAPGHDGADRRAHRAPRHRAGPLRRAHVPRDEGDDASFLESGQRGRASATWCCGASTTSISGHGRQRGRGARPAAAHRRQPTTCSASGATQAKLYAVAARVGSRRFSPRIAAGYTFSSGGGGLHVGELPDEINYSAGFDAALHSPRDPHRRLPRPHAARRRPPRLRRPRLRQRVPRPIPPSARRPASRPRPPRAT